HEARMPKHRTNRVRSLGNRTPPEQIDPMVDPGRRSKTWTKRENVDQRGFV
ncbi:MAG: hypothetical protein ACI9MC_002006, partial [Kiritimatiellia bacterium]